MSYSKYMTGYNQERTYYHLERLYKWKANKIFPPIIVEVSPTGACNQKCIFCYSDKVNTKKSKLNGTILTKTFINMSKYGVKAILLQGTGEPLLNPDIPNAIIKGFDEGLSFSITTNGVLLTPKIQDLILKCFTFIKFSVLDNNIERYCYRHGAPPKHLEQLHNNIKYAVYLREKKNFDTALVGTVYVEKDNFHDIYNIVKFYKQLGLDYIVVQEAAYSEFTPSNQQQYVSSYFSDEEIRKMKEKVYTLNSKNFEVKIRFPVNDQTYHVGFDKSTWKKIIAKESNFIH